MLAFPHVDGIIQTHALDIEDIQIVRENLPSRTKLTSPGPPPPMVNNEIKSNLYHNSHY